MTSPTISITANVKRYCTSETANEKRGGTKKKSNASTLTMRREDRRAAAERSARWRRRQAGTPSRCSRGRNRAAVASRGASRPQTRPRRRHSLAGRASRDPMLVVACCGARGRALRAPTCTTSTSGCALRDPATPQYAAMARASGREPRVARGRRSRGCARAHSATSAAATFGADKRRRLRAQCPARDRSVRTTLAARSSGQPLPAPAFRRRPRASARPSAPASRAALRTTVSLAGVRARRDEHRSLRVFHTCRST